MLDEGSILQEHARDTSGCVVLGITLGYKLLELLAVELFGRRGRGLGNIGRGCSN